MLAQQGMATAVGTAYIAATTSRYIGFGQHTERKVQKLLHHFRVRFARANRQVLLLLCSKLAGATEQTQLQWQHALIQCISEFQYPKYTIFVFIKIEMAAYSGLIYHVNVIVA